MITFLAVTFLCQVILPTYADTTWPMYGGTLENTHFQKMRGAMTDTPTIKWRYTNIPSFDLVYGTIVANTDSDDTMEVLFATDRVYCLNGITGKVKWAASVEGMDPVRNSLAAADINGDGQVEVLVGAIGKIFCFNGATGAKRWDYIIGYVYFASPAIADVNNDDTLEVIIGASSDSKVFCINGVNGQPKWSYAVNFSESSPAIADLDKDDTLDIVFGSPNHKVYCLKGSDGSLEWSYETNGCVSASPSIADVDRDDTLEVVIGSESSRMYCINGATGILEWSHRLGGDIGSAASIADVDVDGQIEIVFGADTVCCLNGNTGNREWWYPVKPYRNVAMADIDGDERVEVLLSAGSNLICLNNNWWDKQWEKSLSSHSANVIRDITIADIDNDGCVELVFGGGSEYSRVFAMDDIGNTSGCGSCAGAEEKDKSSNSSGIKFKSAGEKILFSSPNDIGVDIKIYDVCGRVVQKLYKGNLGSGTHTFSPSFKGKGIYFAVLKTRDLTKSVKFIKVL